MKTLKTYLVFPKVGEITHIEATSMSATSNSIRFLNGKNLIAIFDSSEIRKAGESKLFPEQKNPPSIKTLNNWVKNLPVKDRTGLPKN